PSAGCGNQGFSFFQIFPGIVIDHSVHNRYINLMTAIGRPKEFDREEALDRAMELFWAQGYEATGLRELLEHMGIGRQSLYDTFGDKQRLFVEAIRHYNKRMSAGFVARLSGPGSPTDRIRQAITSIGHSVSDGQCRGCLLTNTLVESAPHDSEIAEAAKSMLSSMENVFRQVLQEAIDEGELSEETNIRALARFLVSTIQGLVVMGKASVSRSATKDIVNVSLSVFD
ncbi:MAG: TetR/AcrR family transcriptional regulator, partial [Planctomycetales bacterium]